MGRSISKCLLAAALFAALPLRAAVADVVGTVTRVENQAQIGSTAAVVGTPVHMNDELRTGPRARLEITLSDQALMTLGENTRLVIDRYVYNPNRGTGAMAVKASQGAMRFVTGKIGQMRDHNVTVVTSQANQLPLALEMKSLESQLQA
jgi:hypothetical protein